MIPAQSAESAHCMTLRSIEDFLRQEAEKHTSENLQRRYKGALMVLYQFLPEDKLLTKDRLLAWRRKMENKGYASATIQNHVKYINRYLDYAGCSEIRFNRGRRKDLSGKTFGYLTAIEPTGAKERGDYIWRFQCRCGNIAELPATRVLRGNTRSCGCLKGTQLKAVMKFFAGTSLTASINEKVESKRAISGYTGVTPKGNKWQAYIKYKGVRYSLGCYKNIQDAVNARAIAKRIVAADALHLLEAYAKTEQTLPGKDNLPKEKIEKAAQRVNNSLAAVARRSDNTSSQCGVSFHKGRWEARISHKGIRYSLGRFEDKEEAIAARQKAEQERWKRKGASLEQNARNQADIKRA